MILATVTEAFKAFDNSWPRSFILAAMMHIAILVMAASIGFDWPTTGAVLLR